ncbi:hypothetical protein [Pilimelia columellifera]|uniref:Uncharacterized protein n=1 Tax=Pilimelia columellifera subsp. columellifera TaxID=706583 RepID=A0ABN3NHS9_9ACTN
MSAFMVSTLHIDLLVSAAVGHNRTEQLRWFASAADDNARSMQDMRRAGTDNADAIGAMLIAENAASLNYRYPGDAPHELEPYRWSPVTDWQPLVVLKAIDCFAYQACEHPGWEASEAWQFCNALRRRMVRQLPGYEAADGWEYTGTSTAAWA